MARNNMDKLGRGHDVETPGSYTMGLGFYSKDSRHCKLRDLKQENHMIPFAFQSYHPECKVKSRTRAELDTWYAPRNFC